MKLRPEDYAFVKDQEAFHLRTAEKFIGDPRRASKHNNYAAQFRELAQRVQFAIDNPATDTPKVDNDPPSFLRIGNMEDLPKELREQIKISDSDKLDMDIIEAIDSFGGVAAIDEVLVALWRKSGKVHERDYIARKIYRLTRNKMIVSVKRKGYFSTDLDAQNGEDDEQEDGQELAIEKI